MCGRRDCALCSQDLAVRVARSASAIGQARQIAGDHRPDVEDPPRLFTDGGRVFSLDRPNVCRQCSRIGWRPGYIMPWPCDAWKLAMAVIAQHKD